MNNLTWTIQKIYQTYSSNRNRVDFESEVAKHPDATSILSISDILNSYGIRNVPARLTTEVLVTQQKPFIAHFNSSESIFVIVRKISKELVHIEVGSKQVQVTLEKFSQMWSGVAILIENEPVQRRRQLTLSHPYVLPSFLVLFLISAIVYSAVAGSIGLYLFIPTIAFACLGVFLSTVLVVQRLDRNSSLVHAMCSSSDGKKDNCGALLNSKAALLYGNFSFAEVGLCYFAGQVLCLVISPEPGTAHMIALFSCLTFPFVFYSVYYQGIIAKKWCKLCLSVMGMLAAQFALTLLFEFNSLFTAVNDLWMPAAIFSLPLLLWLNVRNYVTRAQNNSHELLRNTTLKYDSEVFKLKLQQQRSFSDRTVRGIVIGDPHARQVLTMVTNPFCGPCSDAHKTLAGWLKNDPGFCVKLVFVHSMNEQESNYKFARHMFMLYINNPTSFHVALERWFASDKKNLAQWMAEFPITGMTNESVDQYLQQQSAWCSANKIFGTPMFIIRDRNLPKEYLLEDVKYLLVD